MAHFYNTRVTYIGNGTQTDFSIPFPYDNITEINVVMTGGGSPPSFTFPSTGIIRFATPIANGLHFSLFRDTDDTYPIVDWQTNTSVRSSLLNSMVKQLIRSVQELKDAVYEILAGTVIGGAGTSALGSFSIGDIIVATGPSTIGGLADVAAGSVLFSGGVNQLPVWGTVTYHLTWNNAGNVFGAVTINRALGEAQRITLTNNISSMTITNFGVAGEGIKLVLEVWNTGAYGITWPANVKWANATIPSVTSGAGKKDIYILLTFDAGTTIYGTIVGQNYA